VTKYLIPTQGPSRKISGEKSGLDVVFDEDRSRVRKDHGPENFALLRRMALSVIKAEESKGSIRGKRQTAGWNNDFLEKILLDFTEN
jgi:hypothetical protein